MGNRLCSKCDIPMDSPNINKYHLLGHRRHCRVHSNICYIENIS